MKKKVIQSVGVIMLAAGLVFGVVGIKKCIDEKNAGKIYEELKVEIDLESLIDVPQLAEEMENPIDFESLTAQYPDIYAWIRIPGTRIDYPIVQREGDNSYYLNHTIDGKVKAEGAIFTENYNSKDFLDPNTVIYGHNMKNGSMFKGLHKYKDKQYMLEYSDLYIYQKDQVLRYKIFAAYTYDNRHLMLSFDFKDEDIFRIYLNNVLTKKDMSSNIDTTVEVTKEDRIVTLSTCNNNPKQRYLVQAVLLSTSK